MSTITNVNSVNNGNNTSTFTIDLTIDVGGLDGYSYGFALIFQGSSSTPIVQTAFTPSLIRPTYSTLFGYTGANIGNGPSTTYFSTRYFNRTDVLTYESDGSTIDDHGSISYSHTVVVTVQGCVETIELDGDFRSLGNSVANQACVNSFNTGIVCCGAPSNGVFNATICNRDSIIYNGVTYNANNPTGIDTITTSAGCDSIVTITVIELPSINGSFNQTICYGDSIIYNGVTYNANNPSGKDTLTSVSGCDSIVTITVTELAQISGNYNQSICPGGSFTYNGVVYDTNNLSGTAILSASNGCDSIVSINVTVLAQLSGTLNATICYGDSLIFNGVTYNASNPAGTDTLISVSGCDSIVSINVIILAQLSGSLNATICYGDSLIFNGVTYNASNPSGTDTLTSVSGCDSVVTITVTQLNYISSVLDTTIYSGASILVNGNVYNENNFSGTEIFTASNGCDSIVLVTLVFVNESIHWVPSGFSPNNDGFNDYIYVMGGDFQELEFLIFNRWGELVYESDCCCSNACGWNGYFKGQILNNGTYVYLLKGVYNNGESFKEKGTISLIK